MFVGRLPGNATSQVLRDRFSAFGSVVGVDVRSFKTKRGQVSSVSFEQLREEWRALLAIAFVKPICGWQ